MSALPRAIAAIQGYAERVTETSTRDAEGEEYDYFGVSVAISGNTAIVGAMGDDVGNTLGKGAAYVYVRDAGVWSLQAKLNPEGASPGAAAGISVAIEGDTALVGASTDDVGEVDRGSVFVFVRNGSSWTQQARLVAGSSSNFDGFGTSVALSGDLAVIGVPGDDVGPAVNQGSVHVFRRNAGVWAEQANFSDPDGAAGDSFGRQVALSGQHIVVSSPLDDLGASVNAGSVSTFAVDGDTWLPTAKFSRTDIQAFDNFGSALALEGQTLVVGSRFDDVGNNMNQGSATVFGFQGGQWTETSTLTADDGASSDHFGWSLDLSGSRLVVGGNFSPGAAYVFERVDTQWQQRAKLVRSADAVGTFGYALALYDGGVAIGAPFAAIGGANPEQGAVHFYSAVNWMQQSSVATGNGFGSDRMGHSLSMDGDTLIVGMPEADVGDARAHGAARVYARTGDGWRHQAVLIPPDGASLERSARAVALSGDIAIVGSPFSGSGAAYVFVRTGLQWAQAQKLVATDGIVGDQFGSAVAIDGNRLIVGAPGDDVDAIVDQGAAYIFEFSGNAWVQVSKLTSPEDRVIGTSVSIDADSAIASGRDLAFIHVRTGETWAHQMTLRPAFFAVSLRVAISGNAAIVGSCSESSGAGGARIYRRNADTWTSEADLRDFDNAVGQRFGCAVALDGDIAAVGAYDKDFRGAATIYSRAGGAWSAIANTAPETFVLSQDFGFAVAASVNRVAVGSPGSDGNAPYGNPDEGAAYIYESVRDEVFGNGFE